MNFSFFREQLGRLSSFDVGSAAAAEAAALAQGKLELLLRTLNPDDSKAGPKLQQARADADLAGLRHSRLKREFSAIHNQLRADYEKSSSQWARFVTRQRDLAFEKFIDANAPFWDSRAECARELQGTYVPLCHHISRFGNLENVPAGRDGIALLPRIVESFLERVETACNRFGWAFPTK